MHRLLTRVGLWLGAIALSIGLLLYQAFYPHEIVTKTINLHHDRDRALVGRLYLPSQTAPYPTMILWYGVSSSKEMVEPFALELARHGIAAISFDSGGFGESYPRVFSTEENLQDAKLVFSYVKQHPELFDQAYLGMGGHSMGAATAIAFATETIDADKISVTLDLGMSADISPNQPANLFMGIGLYEEFHTPDAMREMLQQSTGESAKEFQLKGDFAKGSARKLVISSTSDHLIEPFDPTLIQEAVVWSVQAFGLAEATNHPAISLVMPYVMWSWFFIFIGSIMTVSYILRDLQFLRSKLRLVSVGIVAISAILLGLGMNGQMPARLAINLILLAGAIGPISTFAIRYPHKLTSCFRLCGLYVSAILVAYTIVALAMRWNELFTHPMYLLGLPRFLLQIPVALIYSRFQEFSAAMFPVYSNGLIPSWQLTVIFLPELIYPSIFLGMGTKAGALLVEWLRQPLQIVIERPSKKSVQLLGGLSVVLVLVLIQQANMGTISMEHAIATMRLLSQMLLFPVVILIFILRSSQFQKLEKYCKSPN
ncbi:alpha/beta hydrolase [Pseudanabaena sp. ABRG5-3]|uniref:alpha/beta hydrolase n=1 Tax=Pseudanabaena sp. ABRG5-3 TaxID=685565 RepID=UPI000DC6F28A|nr:alpha/beta hydrolase [Pseudanabaena sp. ABRG5-3]BBC26776.1 alpha/beta hydrolase fold protein [Pseudanabaena sp. ABRG5-3]